ncbi:unnamed protein product [Sphagnum troendelagicum]|uniref:DUF4378 domain-containing protein n=1 Tax=Sphagnum troendelagicum TaxID=128251 RepID=A0ABP0U7H8_9BRYO
MVILAPSSMCIDHVYSLLAMCMSSAKNLEFVIRLVKLESEKDLHCPRLGEPLHLWLLPTTKCLGWWLNLYLESLPHGMSHTRTMEMETDSIDIRISPLEESDVRSKSPAVLQELLRCDMTTSKKALKAKLPGFGREIVDQLERRDPEKDAGQKSQLFSQEESLAPHDCPRPQDSVQQQPLLERKDDEQSIVPHCILPPCPLDPSLLSSNSHSQMSFPLKSPLANKGMAHLLEAAVKILEPDMQSCVCAQASNAQQPPASVPSVPHPHNRNDTSSGREGVSHLVASETARTVRSSGYSSATFSNLSASKALCGQSMSRIWNGTEDSEVSSAGIDESQYNLGSVSLLESCRYDCECRGCFDSALGTQARCLSPPGKACSNKAVNIESGNYLEVISGLATSKTNNASMQKFKSEVRNYSDPWSARASERLTTTSSCAANPDYQKTYEVNMQHQARPLLSFSFAKPESMVTDCPDFNKVPEPVSPQVPIPSIPPISQKHMLSGIAVSRNGGCGYCEAFASTMPNPVLAASEFASQSTTKEEVLTRDLQPRGPTLSQAPAQKQITGPADMPCDGRPSSNGGMRAVRALWGTVAKPDKEEILPGQQVFPTESIVRLDLSHGGLQVQSVLQQQSVPYTVPPRCITKSIVDIMDIVNPKVLSTKSCTPEIHQFKTILDQTNGTGDQRVAAVVQNTSQEFSGGCFRECPTDKNAARVREEIFDSATSVKLESKQFECRVTPLHSRARSIDEVFPELPLDSDLTASKSHTAENGVFCKFDVFKLDHQDLGALGQRPGQCMFDKGRASYMAPFINRSAITAPCDEWETYGHKKGALPNNSASVDCNQETCPVVHTLAGDVGVLFPHKEPKLKLFAKVLEDLHAQNEIEKWRRSLSLMGLVSENQACNSTVDSTHDLSNIGDTFNAETGGAWSTTAAEDSADCTPEMLEHDLGSSNPGTGEGCLSPILMNWFVERSDDFSTGVEEGQQPSPVSVLDSPLHDEVSTTSEPSLAEAEQHLDKVLELHNAHVGLLKAHLLVEEKEPSFVHGVLRAAQLLSESESALKCFLPGLPMDPTLFNRLESDYAEEINLGGASVSLSRTSSHYQCRALCQCDCKLLFDSMNEALVAEIDSCGELKPWVNSIPMVSDFALGPGGCKLVDKVYGTIWSTPSLRSSIVELQFVYWGNAKVFVGDGLPALQSYYGHTKNGSAVRISDWVIRKFKSEKLCIDGVLIADVNSQHLCCRYVFYVSSDSCSCSNLLHTTVDIGSLGAIVFNQTLLVQLESKLFLQLFGFKSNRWACIENGTGKGRGTSKLNFHIVLKGEVLSSHSVLLCVLKEQLPI